MDILNLKEKEECQVKISNSYGGLENSDDNVDINWTWESARGRKITSAKEGLSYYEI